MPLAAMMSGQKAAAKSCTKVHAMNCDRVGAPTAQPGGFREISRELGEGQHEGTDTHFLANKIDAMQEQDSDATDNQKEQRFNMAIGMVIVVNIVFMALQMDFAPREDDGQDVKLADKVGWIILDSIFLLIFMTEIGVRLYWERGRWPFSMWNWLDVFIVGTAIVDVWILNFMEGGKDGLQTLTALRIVRLIRLIRMVKLVRAVQGIYVLVMAFMSAMQNMVFIGCLIIFGVLIYAIFATTAIGRNSAFDGVKIQEDSVEDRFGTVYRSMYSLFELMTLEGWDQTARPLVEKQPLTVVFILSFIMIFTFGMLNMVVALVVEKTLEQTRLMAEFKKRDMMKNLASELRSLKSAFKDNDKDGSGSLSREEFEKAWGENDELRSIFAKYHIAMTDAAELFAVLDWDNTGEISVMELVDGIAKIQDDAPSTWDSVATHAGVRNIIFTLGTSPRGHSVMERLDALERHLDRQDEVLHKLLARMDSSNLPGAVPLPE